MHRVITISSITCGSWDCDQGSGPDMAFQNFWYLQVQNLNYCQCAVLSILSSYPSSSTGDKHSTMETSPPRDHVTTTFHTYTSVLHHQRTHSASSTSSQKKDMLSTSVAMSLPSTRFSPDQCSNSFFERNGLLSPHSVVSDKGWPSTPSVSKNVGGV